MNYGLQELDIATTEAKIILDGKFIPDQEATNSILNIEKSDPVAETFGNNTIGPLGSDDMIVRYEGGVAGMRAHINRLQKSPLGGVTDSRLDYVYTEGDTPVPLARTGLGVLMPWQEMRSMDHDKGVQYICNEPIKAVGLVYEIVGMTMSLVKGEGMRYQVYFLKPGSVQVNDNNVQLDPADKQLRNQYQFGLDGSKLLDKAFKVSLDNLNPHDGDKLRDGIARGGIPYFYEEQDRGNYYYYLGVRQTRPSPDEILTRSMAGGTNIVAETYTEDEARDLFTRLVAPEKQLRLADEVAL